MRGFVLFKPESPCPECGGERYYNTTGNCISCVKRRNIALQDRHPHRAEGMGEEKVMAHLLRKRVWYG